MMRLTVVAVLILSFFSLSLPVYGGGYKLLMLLSKSGESGELVSFLAKLVAMDTKERLLIKEVPVDARGTVLQSLYKGKESDRTIAALDTSDFPEMLKNGYNPSSFIYIYPIARNPYVIVTRNDFSWKNISEFIGAGKKVDNRVTIGIVDGGSTSMIIGESILKISKIKFLLVYMHGKQKLVNSIMSGKIGTAILPLSWVYPRIARFKRLKILAVTGDRRARVIPSIPSLKEQGIPGVPNGNTIFIVSSQRISSKEVGDIRKCLKRATSDTEWESFFSSKGYELLPQDINSAFEYTSKEFLKVKSVYGKK